MNALVIPANDNRIYYTEHNWYKDKTGFVETINSGAYIKVEFTGSSFLLDLDNTYSKAETVICWSVDDGSEQNQTLPSLSNIITIAVGLKKHVTHSLYLFLRNHVAQDRWYNLDTRLRIVNITIDDDATLVAPKLAPKRLLAYWDSIGEGAYINGNIKWQWADNAHLTWAFSLTLALNAELSLVAFGAQGYTKRGSGNSPQLWSNGDFSNESSWNWISSNRKRSFESCPDYIINGHGTNDVGNNQNLVFNNSLGWLKDMRKICPISYIFLTVPFGQFCESTLVNVYQAYQDSTFDSFTYLIQMGEQGSRGLQKAGSSFAASDGIHPWAWKSSQLGALLTVKILSLLKI